MILLDCRPSSRLLFRHLPKDITKVVHLDTGDVAFEGNGPEGRVSIGVEHKTLTGLISDILSHRLSGGQLQAMFSVYNYIYLIVQEQNWYADMSTNTLYIERCIEQGSGKRRKKAYVNISDIMFPCDTIGGPSRIKRTVRATTFLSYINTLEVKGGVNVILTNNSKQSCAVIQSLYNWWNRDYDSHHSLEEFYSGDPNRASLTAKFSIIRRLSRLFPGVSWVHSRSIDKEFNSIHEMATSSKERWMSIKGVPQKVLERCYNIIHGDFDDSKIFTIGDITRKPTGMKRAKLTPRKNNVSFRYKKRTKTERD